MTLVDLGRKSVYTGTHTKKETSDMKRASYDHGILVQDDCATAINELQDASVDLVFTSPPYFMGKDYDKSMEVSDFIEAIGEVQQLLYNKLKPGGSICWQVGSHVKDATVTPLDFLVYSVCAQFPDLHLRNRVIWTFEHGAHAKRRLSGRYETVLWYTKGDEYNFDLDPIRVPQKYPGKRHYKGPNKGEYSGNPLGKNPGDVWAIPNVKANHVEKTKHPCQFPVALVSRFIKSLTPENGLVLDPFAGSASTAIAALENRRRFHCIELETEYFAISDRRIKDWYRGEGRTRLDSPIARPDPKRSVAKRPPHFTSEI